VIRGDDTDSSIQKVLPYYIFGILHSLGTLQNPGETLKEKTVLARFNRDFSMFGVIPTATLKIHRKLSFLAFQQLAAEGAVELISDDYADAYVRFRGDPLARIAKDEKLKVLQSKFDRLETHGTDWLASAYSSIAGSADEQLIDAALDEIRRTEPETTDQRMMPKEDEIEDTWQPLPIDRTEPAYQAAIVATDEALEVIEGNNGYAQTEPDERNAIVNSIKGTIAAIKEGTPSVATIKSSLIVPLKYLAKKFFDSAIGITSKIAVEKLMIWLSHLF